MEGAAFMLPRPHDLSTSFLRFLSQTFNSNDDLLISQTIESDLIHRCTDLEASLSELSRRLSDTIASYLSHSDQVSDVVYKVKDGLTNLQSPVSTPHSDERRGEGLGRSEQTLVEELPALAREVARVETVRVYAKTALKLDSLIGDVEDAVSYSVTSKLRAPTN